MSRREQDVLDRLGPRGLSRALEDLLDHARLVRLANTCGLTYPGMRTRSQKRARLIGDLADRALREAATRKAVVRALRREAVTESKAWSALSPEARASRVADDEYLGKAGKLGRLLFVAADDGSSDDSDAALELLRPRIEDDRASTGEDSGPPATSQDGRGEKDDSGRDREAGRLNKKVAELRKKAQYLEGQLRKARDAERVLKRDLMERRGELAEARMRIERLRQETADLREGAEKRESSPAPDRDLDAKLERLARGLRKLSTDQRQVHKSIERMEESASHEHGSAGTRSEAVEGLERVRKEIAALRRSSKRDRDEIGSRLEEVASTIREIGQTVGSADRAPRRRRATGAGARVGVFVDVQNVYYGARQLKGKLDFDALIQTAAGDRRLILAQAYVVESKEIDQTGFIARLQQRAIQVRRKTLQVRADGSMKGDWDMEMALDILDAAPGLDVVVLVSGDGDFTSLVNRVKALGPRVEVMGFPRNTAKSLLEAADRFLPLDRKFMIRGES